MGQTSKKPFVFILMATLGLTACANKRTAYWQTPEGIARIDNQTNRLLAELDNNRDGRITCGDDDLYKDQLFQRADVNRDGVLSPLEYSDVAFREKRYQLFEFDLVDNNDNKIIEKAELDKVPVNRLEYRDYNRDCVVSPEELKQSIIDEITSSSPQFRRVRQVRRQMP